MHSLIIPRPFRSPIWTSRDHVKSRDTIMPKQRVINKELAKSRLKKNFPTHAVFLFWPTYRVEF